jgi:hypothetical protein
VTAQNPEYFQRKISEWSWFSMFVAEKNSVIIGVIGILNAASNFFNTQLHSTVLTLLEVSNNMDFTPNDDVVEWRWFKLVDTLPVLVFEADKFIINRYKNNPDLFLPSMKGLHEGIGKMSKIDCPYNTYGCNKTTLLHR